MTLLMLAALAFAVFSLVQAMFSMARGPDESGVMVRALTRRIAVSVLLFVLLLVGWKFGIIQPHGLGR
jgi:hypothetical protein